MMKEQRIGAALASAFSDLENHACIAAQLLNSSYSPPV